MKLVLKDPVQLGESLISELTFREKIIGNDLKGIAIRENMLYDDLLKIGGRLAGQTEVVMGKMSFHDVVKVAEIVASFLSDGQGTGSKQ